MLMMIMKIIIIIISYNNKLMSTDSIFGAGSNNKMA